MRATFSFQVIGAVYQIRPADKAPQTAKLKPELDNIFKRHKLFGGRSRELEILSRFVADNRSGYCFVTSASGLGKTALLANWVPSLEREECAACYQFLTRQTRTATEEFFFLNLCQQLASFHGLEGSLPTNVSEMKALYSLLLVLPPAQKRRLVVVVDGLDEAQGWSAGPDLFPRELPDGVLVVLAARHLGCELAGETRPPHRQSRDPGTRQAPFRRDRLLAARCRGSDDTNRARSGSASTGGR